MPGGAPRGDQGGREKELGDVAAVVHELGAAADLGDGRVDADEEPAVHELGDGGVRGDGHAEDHQPGRDAGTVGGRVGACDDPGEQEARGQEMDVQCLVQHHVFHGGVVEGREVHRRQGSDSERQRGHRMGQDPQDSAAQGPGQSPGVGRGDGAQDDRDRGAQDQEQRRVHADDQMLEHVTAEVAAGEGVHGRRHGDREQSAAATKNPARTRPGPRTGLRRRARSHSAR